VQTVAARGPHTKYEQKALAEGRRCYYYYWQRNELDAADVFPVPEELTMPHVILQCGLSLEEIASQFREQTCCGETGIIRFAALYRAEDRPLLLVDTFVEEEPLAQRVGLTIRPRRPAGPGPGAGELVVGVHELGFPRPTPGLHAAVACLVRWLLALDPQARLHAGGQHADLPT
jgi:hypothetical protein